MQAVIEKAGVLIEALPYIQKFRNETIVVKFGGSIMEDEAGVNNILNDVAFMACVGMRPVLVHGGGKAISKALREQSVHAEFINGLRVTNADAVGVVEHVLNHEVNPTIVRTLEAYGCKARGMHGDDMLSVTRHTETDPASGKILDWGFVGSIQSVDAAPVEAFLHSGITPVVTPLGRGADKKVYNINADDVAAAIAVAMKARKLVFLSDVPGVMADPSDEDSLFSTIHAEEMEDLIERGVIQGGMLPKLRGAMDALRAGVKKTHIINASMTHSLLLELFTDKGVGTEIISS